MKIFGRILLFITLLPMWIIWFICDLSDYGSNYEEWQLYDVFIN